jgi:hypothetical protein
MKGPQEHTVERKSETNKLEEKEGIQYMEFLDMASIYYAVHMPLHA